LADIPKEAELESAARFAAFLPLGTGRQLLPLDPARDAGPLLGRHG
jgi:hypothetical protein